MKICIVCLLALMFIVLSVPGLAQQPPMGSSTVVGGIVVELSGSYPLGNNEFVLNGLPVRIACQYIDNSGKERLYTYETKTDVYGYYILNAVPEGRYILKAVELDLGRGAHITAASEWGRWQKGDQYRYWGLLNGKMYQNQRYLIETHFEVPIQSEVIDLGIRVLIINANEVMGGTSMSRNYSPNGTPPWVRMSLRDGSSIIYLNVLNDKSYADLDGQKIGDTQTPITMAAPAQYFDLK